jgi:hypothetical protein
MHHTLYTAVATREIYWIISELYRLLVFVSVGMQCCSALQCIVHDAVLKICSFWGAMHRTIS